MPPASDRSAYATAFAGMAVGLLLTALLFTSAPLPDSDNFILAKVFVLILGGVIVVFSFLVGSRNLSLATAEWHLFVIVASAVVSSVSRVSRFQATPPGSS